MTPTLQSLFSKAYRGLRKQGFKRSLGGVFGKLCVYGRPGEMACAIGHLMTPEQAKKADANPGSYVHVRRLLPAPVRRVLDGDDYDSECCLGTALQWAHDEGKRPSSMRRRLVAFAKRHGLKVPR